MKREVIIPAQIQNLIDGMFDKSNAYTVRKNFYDRLFDVHEIVKDNLSKFEDNERVDNEGW